MYQALYRKYRPKTFLDVVGQEHITTTLQNQLKSGKTAHAYLFTGSRGTGKTTCARIFAKAVNCLHPVDGNPCLECEICREADAGSLPDIIEIDAASNNGVADVRDLREGAVYTPERCKVKVFIIDEVHMLSKDAFNALLKIMEEPPPHVKFILATTELHKVLPTVISRCQRFDFMRVALPELVSRLKTVAEAEKVSLSDDAALLIAKTADGGMRDALSLLDTCMAYASDITLDIVSETAGIAGRDTLFELIDAICKKDSAAAVTAVDKMYAASKDMTRLCVELVEQFRNIMMLQALNGKTDDIVALPEELEKLSELAKTLSPETVLTLITELQKLTDSLPRALEKRTAFELAVVKLCSESLGAGNAGAGNTGTGYAGAGIDPGLINSLTQRVQHLEQRLQSLSSNPLQYNYNRPVNPPPQAAESAPAQAAKPLSMSDFKPLQIWDEALERFSQSQPHIAALLTGSRALYYENQLLVFAENKFFLEMIKKRENAEHLQAVLFEMTGTRFFIRAKCTAPEAEAKSDIAQKIVETAAKSGVSTEVI